MDALTDFDKLPIFSSYFYEKEALRLKEGQSEDRLDEDLRASALAAGIDPNDLDLPHDVVAAGASPLRRSSVSGTTQASCSTDVTSPESPASTDGRDRALTASPPARQSMFAAPPSGTYSRHSTPSLSSTWNSTKPKFFRRMSSFSKKVFSSEDQAFRSSSKHPYTPAHRFSDVSGRVANKYARVKEDSVADIDADSAILPDPSRTSSPDSVISHHQNAFSCSMTRQQRAALRLAMENSHFRDMWMEYTQTWEWIAIFEKKQKQLLQFYEKFSRKSLQGQYELLRDRVATKHSGEVERLEEKQLKADLSLEQTQREEKTLSAAALKHMKAYCSGSSLPGSHKRRIVTDDDKRRLREQEKLCDGLDDKYEAARKMARARQEKELKDLKHEHEQQTKELDKKHKEARTAFGRIIQVISRQLEEVIIARRLRVVRRWYINLQLWDKSTGENEDIPTYGELPTTPWPDNTALDTLAARTSSVLDTWKDFNDLPPAVSLLVPTAPE